MNKLAKQANMKLIKSNSTNFMNPLHSLIVRKLNNKEKSSKIISNEIKDYLNLPEKFFSPNSKVIIGKKINLKDMKSIGIEPIITKKTPIINKRMSTFFRKSLSFNNFESSVRNSLAYNFKEKQQTNDKYEIIDNEQLKKIFNKFKTFYLSSKNDEKKNNFPKLYEKNNGNETFSFNNSTTTKTKKSRNKNIPFNLTEYLTFQNNKLKIIQNIDNKIKNISKRLSKILNKDESDLLLNRIDDYSFKKELIKEIDFNKPIDENYGKYKWNISLRRPKNFEGVRNSYINLTREKNPFWGIVVEKSPKIKEVKMRPGILTKNKHFLEKFKKAHPKNETRDFD